MILSSGFRYEVVTPDGGLVVEGRGCIGEEFCPLHVWNAKGGSKNVEGGL